MRDLTNLLKIKHSNLEGSKHPEAIVCTCKFLMQANSKETEYLKLHNQGITSLEMIESSKLLIDKSQTEKHLFPLLIGGTSPMLGARRKPEVTGNNRV